MLCVTKLWVLLLCSKTLVLAKIGLKSIALTVNSASIAKSESNIFNYKVDLTLNEVNINGNMFTNHRQNGSHALTVISKLHAIYFMTNCEFAHRTVFKIYEFIKMCPLFYRNEFQHNDLYDEENKEEFRKNLKSFLANAHLFDSLLKALHVYFMYKSKVSLHHDTAVMIKTLLSLLVKSYYISSSISDETKSFISDVNIIRLILIDMIDIQRFLLMGCPEVPACGENLQMYGIWVLIDAAEATNQNFDKLLNVTRRSVEYDNLSVRDCKTEQLFGIISIDLNDDDFKDISTAKIRITRDKSISIEDVLKQTKTNFDIHLLSWYHDLILSAVTIQIVKKGWRLTLYPKLLTKQLCKDVLALLTNIQFKLQPEFVPSHVIEGLEILKKRIIKYIQTTDVFRMERRETQYINWLSNTKIDTGKLQASMSHAAFGVTVLRLLQLILDNVSNFKCLYLLFNPVKESYDKFHKPLAIHTQFLRPEINARIVLEECNFVTTIYSICYQGYAFMNGYIDSSLSEDKTMFLSATTNAILYVKNSFLLVVKKGTSNADMLKIAYDVSTILVNFSLDFKRNLLDVEVKRIFSVIMNEMNSYSIKYCVSNGSNFFAYNNVNFYEIGNAFLADKSIRTFMENGVNNFEFNDFKFRNSVNEKDYRFLNVQHFMADCMTRSIAYKAYSETILVNWNGSVQTIKSIFEYERNLIICTPPTVNALYEVYFKFCAGVVFCRIKEILANNKHLKDVKTGFKAISETLGKRSSWLDFFPMEMNDILLSIDNWFLYLEEDWIKKKKVYHKQELISRLRRNIKLVEEKFEDEHISFGNTLKNGKNKTWMFCVPIFCQNHEKVDSLKIGKNPVSDDEFKKIANELLTNVRIVLENYLKLTKEPSNTTYDNEPEFRPKDVPIDDKEFVSENTIKINS